MSRLTKSTYTPSTKPVCVHCRNLGLPFDHWLRSSVDANSQVVCPILLNTECRYCHQFGHTVGRCPVILHEKNPEVAKKGFTPIPVAAIPVAAVAAVAKAKENTLEKKKTTTVNRGGFSALDSDTEDEEEETVKPQKIQKTKTPVSSVAKPKTPITKTPITKTPITKTPIPKSEQATHVVNMDFTPMVILTEQMKREVAETLEENHKLFTSGKSWAEICYDLDEQEEEMRRRNA